MRGYRFNRRSHDVAPGVLIVTESGPAIFDVLLVAEND